MLARAASKGLGLLLLILAALAIQALACLIVYLGMVAFDRAGRWRRARCKASGDVSTSDHS